MTRLGFILGVTLGTWLAWSGELITHPTFANTGRTQSPPPSYRVQGAVRFGDLGDLTRESSGRGVRLDSALAGSQNRPAEGRVSTDVSGIRKLNHRWFRFSIRGLAQDAFVVEQDDLFLEVAFFGNSANDELDKIKRRIYPQVRRERADLADPSTKDSLGNATWRTYAMEFRTPFPEVDRLTLTAGFSQGQGKAARSEFWIREFHLEPIAAPSDFRSRQGVVSQADLRNLIHLGGRWYYDPTHLPRTIPTQFDHTNANRLLYLSDRLEAPFVDNTSAWLQDGFYDVSGKLVKRPRFIANNVVIRFTKDHLIMQSHNLPNHPTAFFPDVWRAMDGNPNYVREMHSTWHLPLNPQTNPNHVAMTLGNQNNALPGGPIGVAVNGVVFFNPYDLERTEDAIWRLDRCCGHPSPTSQYHYHKYPVCIKSPWSDDGAQHSPLIGFAFDGFPVYGPYESKGVLAKNDTSNPLNEFNVHQDPERGWHYHVTPGSFPHVIGGYWGTVDSNNRRARGARGPRNGRGRPGRRAR